MLYGKEPVLLGRQKIEFDEMCHVQYMPVKMPNSLVEVEPRLHPFLSLIHRCSKDFIQLRGSTEYKSSYIYLTVKKGYMRSGCPFNRTGYHSDGFLTDDINYIWSDKNPTVFCVQPFDLTMDDSISMVEVTEQARPENECVYRDYSIIRLDQYNIHRVNEEPFQGMRTFVKVSFSLDKYDLKGNSHNFLFDYDWQMRDRKTERNIPQLHSNQ